MKHFSVPITKRNDDLQMVYGYASTPARDLDGDIITLDALKGSLPDYVKFSNIREMHGMNAVGVAKEAQVDDKGLYIGAKIVDPLAWLKVKEGVYKAFSIGGNATNRAAGDPHTITGLQLIEISLVDRPANPEAVIDIFKAVEIGKEPAVDKEEDLRAELSAAVNQLSGDELKSAVAALRKSKAPEEEPAHAPQPVAKVAAPAPQVAGLPEIPSVSIAKKLKAPGAAPLCAAVAKAVGFTDKQFGSVMALDERALGNWLANNHGLLEIIQKSIPEGSHLWAVDQQPVEEVVVKASPKSVVMQDDNEIRADVMKGIHENPKGEYGTHDEVCYADTGFQADEKARFPLKEKGVWSEVRIRAAHDFMAKAKNHKNYAADAVTEIQKNITTAWNAAKIPQTPTTENNVTKTEISQPDAKGDLRKGLMTACAAIAILKRFDDLQKSIAAEEAREGDGSEVGARFKTILTLAAAAIQSYLDEEVTEMLSGEGDEFDYGMPYSNYVEYADKATGLLKTIGGGAVSAEILEKTIGDRTGAKGYANLTKFAEDILAKSKPSGESGDWSESGMPGSPVQPQDWKEKAQTMHDLAKSLGATCTAETHKAKDKKEKDGDMEDVAKKAAAKDKDEVAKGKKGPNDGGGDDEEEDTTGEDDNEDDDEGGSDNPKKPAKKAKKSAEVDVAGLVKAVVEAMSDSPLAKSVEALQTEFKSIRKNPPLPGKAVAKSADITERPDAIEKADKEETPDDVLKGCLSRPNRINK